MSKDDFPHPSITGDVIVFDVFYNKVLLIERKNEPYANTWAIVGGFFNAEDHHGEKQDVSVEAAAIRELKEEANIDLGDLHDVGGWSFKLLTLQDAPGRDPRGRVVTAVYTLRVVSGPVMARINVVAKPKDDAKALAWYPILDVVLGKVPLAFDHQDSVRKLYAQEYHSKPWETNLH